ncbi:MAG TPA: 2-succinyl-5-enolpyruvyl-6-hydroxy-3-cyclohexene-1-carboxylic-acid synthase [Dermatophilaceae bacterium]|jgi:2-succinyl-5-enolpyruvyl-6-hydroxy-3-cyclohexene-1-carboxylate synthase|nr:MAG: 2-succinyl-5-enolpyruvyl-6-hydroxy-3-cyclohexene-1-carboxylate synthase [bacterium ADurb.BinA028]HNV14860.1 2-succinyl-5-enolpyruvyl-6-hydroxy-3-cyclohexene-1-carboxylic-acid synthase [Dermatophilaceae bacterium]HOA57585.1 2-succinyl-5-enolpyruvyl-6-hydroxy-3-cyclohexene-1-carboxylic-acid synthase [Dermatophilaceae bacterium]HPZ69880.1 2-succinyl-5-enolpyruvyl-6-hydroxy-3-cyclohexene-1-carboxylic-acid synthase [Dermatophilaceae bacterium]HQD01806.1 2-succinyl-5-enolpyruvyl-6-hydroxy-3-c
MTITSAARAIHVLRGLLAAGVREVVLSPGSRSAPLALALHAADAAGDVRLHVRLDERSAGFLALGLAVGSRSPVAVVMTSGTAVGNLLPAVMEAHHAGRPLIVVSADRPASLRATGANQTTWQDGIFGVFAPTVDVAVDASHDAVSQAVTQAGLRLGPSHLNVQFDAPLLPDPGMPWWPGLLDASDPLDPSDLVDSSSARTSGGSLEEVPLGAEAVTLVAGPRTVVLAGDDAGSAARVLAESAGVPLLAEPTSGSRAGDHAIRTYRLLLGTALGAAIERVIVIGHPTLSRPVTALLSRPDIALYAVRTRTGVATDPARRAIILDVPPALTPALPLGQTPGLAPDADAKWLTAWQAADAALAERVDAHVEALPDLHALHVAAEVSAALSPGQSLVVGSSNPIRDLDLMLPPYRPGEHRLVVANRGLAGIDGTVSTAIGVALGRAGRIPPPGRGIPPSPEDGGIPRPGRSLAVMGDLTFLHDSGGLLIGPDEPRPDLTIVVVNDDGGSIFALLEQGTPDYAAAFERVFATPVHADLQALAGASHTAYRRVESRVELREALSETATGPLVIEARVGRADRRETAAALGALAADLPLSWPPDQGGMP